MILQGSLDSQGLNVPKRDQIEVPTRRSTKCNLISKILEYFFGTSSEREKKKTVVDFYIERKGFPRRTNQRTL